VLGQVCPRLQRSPVRLALTTGEAHDNRLALTLLSGLKSGARTLPPSVGSQAMDNLLFWLGIGAAQKGAGSKGLKPSRHPIISFVVGILIALAIVAGMFFLLVSQQ
jgi:hypothetical protein